MRVYRLNVVVVVSVVVVVVVASTFTRRNLSVSTLIVFSAACLLGCLHYTRGCSSGSFRPFSSFYQLGG